MKKIIIEYDDDISAVSALQKVISVINNAPRSYAKVEGCETEHFCWATTFRDNTEVIVRKKKRKNSADSLIVRKS